MADSDLEVSGGHAHSVPKIRRWLVSKIFFPLSAGLGFALEKGGGPEVGPPRSATAIPLQVPIYKNMCLFCNHKEPFYKENGENGLMHVSLAPVTCIFPGSMCSAVCACFICLAPVYFPPPFFSLSRIYRIFSIHLMPFLGDLDIFSYCFDCS